MSEEESTGGYQNDEYVREYEENNQRENQQLREENSSEDRVEARSEPRPSGSGSDNKKSKRHKSSRKRHRSDDEDRPAANENLSNLDLLNNLTNYFEGRFKEIKQELIEENQALCNKMNKRFKTTEHTFKKSGNRFQYHHNIDVASKVEEAQAYLEKKSPSVKKAKEALAEGMSIIEERNKDILVADTSEGGWDTVNEYKKKQIAEDSDDDKKLRKADTSAVRKREQRKKKYKQSKQRSWQSYQPRNDYHHNEYNYSRNQNSYRPQKPSSSFRRRNRDNDCFSCGGADHWKVDCPFDRPYSSGHYPSNRTN